jgi:shikimate dehydrogenase
MRISGKTKITGLFGYPVEHTLSPFMHNAAFIRLGLDYCYIPFSVHPDFLRQAVEGIRALNIVGVNLTIPLKESVIPLLDEVDEEASFIGAVNTIVNREGRLAGYNTDGRGFMRSLAENGVSVEGKRVLIVGAGGASRGIGYYLCRQAGSLSLFNRTAKKAADLAAQLSFTGGRVDVIGGLDQVGGFDMVINATPLGLKKDDPLPFDAGLLRAGQVVCDLIYRKTALLRLAEEKGCKTVDGLAMLLWQGALAFELWTGLTPPVEDMKSALLQAIN